MLFDSMLRDLVYTFTTLLIWLFVIFLLCLTVHGVVLAFQASILLGVIVLFVEPAPLVIGVAYWFWGVNLAEKFMVEFVNK